VTAPQVLPLEKALSAAEKVGAFDLAVVAQAA
jgi:hypothetical protein